MKWRRGLWALPVLLLLTVVFLVLCASENGSRWLVRSALSVLPIPVSMTGFEGRLLERFQVTGLTYQSATERVSVGTFTLAWQAQDLLFGHLHITDVTLDDLSLSLNASEDSTPKSPFDISKTVYLPLDVSLDHLAVRRLNITQTPQSLLVDKLEISATTANGVLKINTFSVQSPQASATLQGQLGLGNGYPLQLHTDWQVNLSQDSHWQGRLEVTGDLRKLKLKSLLNTPFTFDMEAEVSDAISAPRIIATGHWQNLAWPFVGGQAQVQSQQGSFEFNGLLSDYQITVNSRLIQQYLPEARLQLTGNGNLEGFTLKQLALTSTTGAFQVAGKVAWQPQLAFDLSTDGQNFNPAIVNPELNGNLTFNTHLQGKLGASTEGVAEIKHFSGQLRGYPVKASGKLSVQGEQWQVDALRIHSGVNQLAVDGHINPTQTDLVVDMQCPNLAGVWPGLKGSLLGGGHLQGSRSQPQLSFSAQGKALAFAQHRLEQLDLTMNIQADPQKSSQLKLQARHAQSGTLQIEKLSLNAQGSVNQHQLDAQLLSNLGTLNAELSGAFSNNIWQGRLSQLDLESQQAGQWRLGNPWLLKASVKDQSFDVSVGKSCLVQQAAAVCMAGDYWSNQDFKLALTSTELPLSLLDNRLPADLHSNATLNGEATLQQQKGKMAGHYRFATTPSTLTIGKKDLPLGASSLEGSLNGDKLAAVLNFALVDKDSLQADLKMALPSQAISGTLFASMSDLSLYQALIPTLTELKGGVQTQLSINGNLKKPLVNGHIDIANARFATPQVSVGQINLRAEGQGDQLHLQGSASPTRFRPEAAEPIQINSLINLNIQLQQQKSGRLQGSYQLSNPGQTTLETEGKSVTLGALTASGDISGQTLATQWDVALQGQDFCRGNLQADLSENAPLSGQLSASLSQFQIIEFFAPQISDVKGLLTADIGIEGNRQTPQIKGAFNLKNGAFTVNSAGLSVHDIRLSGYNAIDQPQHLQIQGSAQSGAGKLKLEGFADFLTQPEGLVDLLLTGENFEIAKIPEAQIAVSPALTIKAIGKQTSIKGTLQVPKALLTLQEIPENAVKVSADEVILGAQPKPESVATPSSVDADIVVELGNDVRFSGQGFTTQLQGRLAVTNKTGKLAMNGNIDLKKAAYKRFGQSLTVRKGQFLFNGPVDNPWVDVEAIRLSKSKTVTAVLALSGPLQHPKTKVYSEPALPETDALAYLVTGGPLGQVSQSNSNALAGAALSYGAGQMAWLTTKLGVDEFAVEEGQTLQDSLLAVGQYLTPDFYVGAKVGLFNKQAVLVLKHNLGRSLNVETQTGTSQRIKLNYEFDRN
ncbi:hypothetical protein JCM14076_03180 [Methylosoma difficile]